MAYVNHTLDTSNIENLATDLSARLTAKIKYGYYDASYDFVAVGSVGEYAEEFELVDAQESRDSLTTIVYNLQEANILDPYEIWIYKDCFLADACYLSGRFILFSEHFTGKLDYWKEELKFRFLVWEEAKNFGGDMAIYTGDQCGADYIRNDVETTEFYYVLNRVKAMSRVTDISQFLRDMPNSCLKEDPDAFIDDFSYMPVSI